MLANEDGRVECLIAGRRGTVSERAALQAVEWMLTAELTAIEKRAVELRNAIATVKGIAAEADRARSEESDTNG